MPSELPFEAACGSVVGRDHVARNDLLIGRNNQDGVCWRHFGNFAAAVVADGCGSGKSSELGAALAAKLLVSSIEREYSSLCRRGGGAPILSDAFFERVRLHLLAQIQLLARELTPSGGSFTETIAEHFLFTVVAAVLTPDELVCVSNGDGVIAVNGRVMQLGPFAGNMPPYLCYALVDSPFGTRPELLSLQNRVRMPIGEVDSLLVGSDGVGDLINAEPRLIPGRPDEVGPLSQFWEDDQYFQNPDALRRKLAILNSTRRGLDESRGGLWTDFGLLPDDTSLVVFRRLRSKPAEC